MPGIVEQLKMLLAAKPDETVAPSAARVVDSAVPGMPGDVRYQMLSRQIPKEGIDPLTRRSMVDALASMPELAKHTSRIRVTSLPQGMLGRADGSEVTIDPAQAPGHLAATAIGHEMTHTRDNAEWPMWKKVVATGNQGGRRVVGALAELLGSPETAEALEQGGMAEKGAYDSESETYRRAMELTKQRAKAKRK